MEEENEEEREGKGGQEQREGDLDSLCHIGSRV